MNSADSGPNSGYSGGAAGSGAGGYGSGSGAGAGTGASAGASAGAGAGGAGGAAGNRMVTETTSSTGTRQRIETIEVSAANRSACRPFSWTAFPYLYTWKSISFIF